LFGQESLTKKPITGFFVSKLTIIKGRITLKKTLTLFTVMVLLVSSTFSVLSLNMANGGTVIAGFEQLPLITINKDGTITPETANITHNGDTYYLMSDLIRQYNIVIERDNVIFDGGGHLIDVWIDKFYGDYYNDSGIALDGVNNVTVRNVRVNAWSYQAPYIKSNNCTFEKVNVTGGKLAIEGNFNVITDCNTDITLWGGSNNSITRNTLNDVYIYVYDKSNKIFANNIYPKADFDSFYHNKYHGNSSASWDNGSIGNYWVDYLTKYPNSSEIGSTGIGNSRYVITKANIDFYPLMYPINAPQINLTRTENATYTDSFPLNFTVNKPIKWMGYSLDGAENVTVTGNTTVNGIPAGVHNITVYATDIYGFEDASTVTFTTTAQIASLQAASPELLLTAAVGIVATIAVLGFVFWKKKRQIG
jgi:hypothetical protein